jgi:hypothetical protein
MTINQVYESIGEAKKSGQFQTNVLINSADKTRIAQALAKDNFIVIALTPANLIITWIGSKEWYQQSLIKLPYSADMISKVVLPKIIELIGNVETVKFLNPLLNAKVISKYDKTTGNVTKTFEKDSTVSSALYKVISKF